MKVRGILFFVKVGVYCVVCEVWGYIVFCEGWGYIVLSVKVIGILCCL